MTSLLMSLMTSHTSSSKCANDQNLVVIYTFHPKWRFHVITTLCLQRFHLNMLVTMAINVPNGEQLEVEVCLRLAQHVLLELSSQTARVPSQSTFSHILL